MLDSLLKWKGKVVIDGVEYASINEIPKSFVFKDGMCISLLANVTDVACQAPQASSVDNNEFKVTVKQYMTKPATPEFDFMEKWNNNVPMPLRVMVGKKIKETRGMVYMELHADILEERTQCCMRCGRPITNPVSQYFGMGPECGGHGYVNPFASDAELKAAVEQYRKELQKITWTGWIIKSAITEMEEI